MRLFVRFALARLVPYTMLLTLNALAAAIPKAGRPGLRFYTRIKTAAVRFAR